MILFWPQSGVGLRPTAWTVRHGGVLDWDENDRICTAVLFHRPLIRKRDIVLITDVPVAPEVVYRDRVVVKEVPGPIEYRDRVVVKEVPGPIEYRDPPPPEYHRWLKPWSENRFPIPQPTITEDDNGAYPKPYDIS